MEDLYYTEYLVPEDMRDMDPDDLNNYPPIDVENAF